MSSSRWSPAIRSTLSVPRPTDSSFGRKGSSDQLHTKECLMKETSKVRKIAFVGDHLPRKCGIATFTSDLLARRRRQRIRRASALACRSTTSRRLRVPGCCPLRNRRAGPFLLSARRRLPEHQQRGCCLPAARVRHLRRPRRRSYSGVAARIANAGRDHAAYRSAGPEDRTSAA